MRSQSLTVDTNKGTKKAFLLATAVGFFACAGLAGSASALETLGPMSVAQGECPALTSVKYPFIRCSENEYGGLTLTIPGQPAPLACNMLLPDGECAAGPYEWDLVPRIPRGAR
jgi:hypothetical protein